MRVILFLLCILALLAGCAIFAASKSAIHEIEAFILFLISAVLLSAAALIDAVIATRKKLEAALKSTAPQRAKATEGIALTDT